MKRLLQRTEDGLYYQGPGNWISNPELACIFPTTAGAIECCLRENLPAMQLVLKFEDEAFDIRVPCWSGNGRGSLGLAQPGQSPSEEANK